ncbi:hypothetical protein AAHA92_21630 [Salvia divinorum]|uniref:Secreted protein n=1 Tax=Salvia divinorum TaxID=28513 RepID=A0ABD1GL24_SALDI
MAGWLSGIPLLPLSLLPSFSPTKSIKIGQIEDRTSVPSFAWSRPDAAITRHWLPVSLFAAARAEGIVNMVICICSID